MRPFDVLALVAGLAGYTLAQVTTTVTPSLSGSTTYTPTNTWTQPNGACSKGMGAAAAAATAGGQGGVYQDKMGAYWEMVSVEQARGNEQC